MTVLNAGDNKMIIFLDLNIIGQLQTFTLKWSVMPQPMPFNVNKNDFYKPMI
jgi:hypothetical protein